LLNERIDSLVLYYWEHVVLLQTTINGYRDSPNGKVVFLKHDFGKKKNDNI